MGPQLPVLQGLAKFSGKKHATCHTGREHREGDQLALDDGRRTGFRADRRSMQHLPDTNRYCHAALQGLSAEIGGFEDLSWLAGKARRSLHLGGGKQDFSKSFRRPFGSIFLEMPLSGGTTGRPSDLRILETGSPTFRCG